MLPRKRLCPSRRRLPPFNNGAKQLASIPKGAEKHAQQKFIMKIKILGVTLLEIECGIMLAKTPPADVRGQMAALAQPERVLALADLHRPSSVLPRSSRGTIDVDASLRALGITDTEQLWLQHFRKGTAGAALKCILGGKGQGPKCESLETTCPELHTYPAEKLPVNAEGKLDVDACLALFAIKDPTVLWQERFRPGSAGGRIKMRLRATGFVPHSTKPSQLTSHSQDIAASCSSLSEEPPEKEESGPVADLDLKGFIRQTTDGEIDIQGSLAALAIHDPKSLWQKPASPGSAEHVLKKEIARRLARREPVAGITRTDVGLTP